MMNELTDVIFGHLTRQHQVVQSVLVSSTV